MPRKKEFEAKLEVSFTAEQLDYIESIARLANKPKGNVVRFMVQQGIDRRRHNEDALSALLGVTVNDLIEEARTNG